MATKTDDRKDTERETIPSDEARQRLGELIDRAGHRGERILISRHGKAIVALIGMEDLAVLDGEA